MRRAMQFRMSKTWGGGVTNSINPSDFKVQIMESNLSGIPPPKCTSTQMTLLEDPTMSSILSVSSFIQRKDMGSMKYYTVCDS